MLRVCVVAAVLIAGLPSAGVAAGMEWGTPPSGNAAQFEQARTAIEGERYADAVPILEQIVAEHRDHADALNLLGFSHRKLGNRDQAYGYYQRALAVEPRHRGALAYLGELYLERGDLALAEAQLDRLGSICWFGCTEERVLQDAIEAYKAAR